MSEHELWNELGNLYFLTGALPQAVRAYNRSIEMDEGFGRPYSNLALTYVQQGRFDEAVDLYRRSIELLAESKDKAITWNRLGNVYRHLKDYQHAVQAYRQADELDPESGTQHEEPGWLADPAAETPAPQRQPSASATQAGPTLTLAETAEPAAANASPTPSAAESMAGWIVADAPAYQEDMSESLDPGSLTTWGDPNQTEDDPAANWAVDPDEEIFAPDVDGNDLTKWLPVPEEPQDLLDMVLDSTTAPAYMDERDDEAEILEPFPFAMPEPEDEAARMVVFPFALDGPGADDAEVKHDDMPQSVEVSSELPQEDGARAEDDIIVTERLDVRAETPTEDEAASEEDLAEKQDADVRVVLPEQHAEIQDPQAEAVARAFASVLPAGDIPAADVESRATVVQAEVSVEALSDDPGAQELDEPAAMDRTEIEPAPAIAGLLPAISSSQNPSEPSEQNVRKTAELDVIVQELGGAEFIVAGDLKQSAKGDDVNQAAEPEPGSGTAGDTHASTVTRVEVSAPERDEDEMHEIEKGIAKFKRVVQVNPRNAHAWDALGNLYKAGGLYKEALLAYEQAISNDPSKALYHHHLGLVYACEGRTEEAIDAFQRVIEIDPDHSLAHATLGGYYRKMGLEELAQKHVGKAMKSIFDSENEYNRACLAAICGNTDQALDLLRVALNNKQTYVDWILRDPDLDFIRQDPRFKQLISDYAS